MNRVIFRDAMVWDGSGAEAYPADVLVEGNRIRSRGARPGPVAADGATVDRRPRHDADAGPGRRPCPYLLRRRGERHGSRRYSARGASAAHHAQCQDPARPWLHQRLQRGHGEAPPRHRHPQRDQCRPLAGPAHSRLRARRSPSPAASATSASSNVPRELRHDRRRRRGDRHGRCGCAAAKASTTSRSTSPATISAPWPMAA